MADNKTFNNYNRVILFPKTKTKECNILLPLDPGHLHVLHLTLSKPLVLMHSQALLSQVSP